MGRQVKMSQIETVDYSIYNAIREYFLQKQYFETLKTFEDERHRLSDSKTNKINYEKAINIILDNIEKNNQKQF